TRRGRGRDRRELAGDRPSADAEADGGAGGGRLEPYQGGGRRHRAARRRAGAARGRCRPHLPSGLLARGDRGGGPRACAGRAARLSGRRAMNDPGPRQSSGAFARACESWKARYEKELATNRQLTNRSGIETKPLYTPDDWSEARYMRDLGFPGD